MGLRNVSGPHPVRLVASLRGAISRVGSYWRVARGVADESLSRADEAHPFEIASLLILSTTVAIPLTGLLALLGAFATTSQDPWVRVVGLAPSLLIGLICLAALTWTALRARGSPAPERLFALSMIAVVPGVMVAVVATAGLFTTTTVIEANNPTGMEFWRAALYFLWSAVDSIPVLEVSDLTGWTQTPPAAPDVAKWMALFLRLVLLVPLVRVIAASYAWARRRHRASDEDAGWWFDRDESIQSSLVLLAWIVGTFVAAVAFLRWMAAPSSAVPRLVGDWVPATVTLESRTMDLTWIPSAVQWIGLTVLLWLGGIALLGFVAWAVRTLSPVAAGILLVDLLALLVTGTLLAALLLGRLVQSGLGHVTPDMPSGPGVGTAVEALVWPLVDALPLVGVTDILGWQPVHSFSGVFVGLVQVGYRLAVVGALVTVSWLIVNLTRWLSGPPIPITAADTFARHLSAVEAELDLARNAQAEDRRRMMATYRATVRNHLSRLSIVSRELERVYGHGEVSQSAVRAIEAAREETSATLGTSTWRRSSSVWESRRDTLTMEQAASAFCAAVAHQHRAAEPVSPSDRSAE